MAVILSKTSANPYISVATCFSRMADVVGTGSPDLEDRGQSRLRLYVEGGGLEGAGLKGSRLLRGGSAARA